MNEIHCTVTGRVQMVMFRDFVQRQARALHISGTVRNVHDGTVEVIAQGTRENLEKLIAKLHRGPLLARVDGVDVRWEKPQSGFEGFTILY